MILSLLNVYNKSSHAINSLLLNATFSPFPPSNRQKPRKEKFNVDTNPITKQTEQILIDGYERFYRLAYSYVQNREDALDVVQESACKAIRDCGQVKNTDFLSTWIYRIVINTSLDLLRKNKKEIPAEEMPEIPWEDKYQELDLKTALKHLDEKSRTIVMLRYFEDMKLENISRVVDENLNTVKARLYRALKKLRITMEPEEPKKSYAK